MRDAVNIEEAFSASLLDLRCGPGAETLGLLYGETGKSGVSVHGLSMKANPLNVAKSKYQRMQTMALTRWWTV